MTQSHNPAKTALIRALISIAPAALMLSPMAATIARAQPQAAAPVLNAPEGTDEQVRAFWTPERILRAIPMERHIDSSLLHGHANHTVKGAQSITTGASPKQAYDAEMATSLYDESQVPQRRLASHIRPPLGGTGGIPFTTNRLYPQSDVSLYKVYPYSTIGQLYFTIGTSEYVCTASVIRRNVIATAGHCVNDGSGNYYANWMFVPAENGSLAPFGTWTWAGADTTSAWYSGGGGVPNEQDDAVIVLNQQKVKHDGRAPVSLGDVVGYLGYEFNAPLPTAITQIGYPCNLDSCVDPVATYSADTAGPTNNFQWGTYSYGGASGGPELQDFGQAPSGVPSEPLGGNILVSSTSYDYTNAAVEVDGGSILYAPGQNGEYTFGDLINWACGFTNAC
jgi:V8-like Glu-specific endopeptidase